MLHELQSCQAVHAAVPVPPYCTAVLFVFGVDESNFTMICLRHDDCTCVFRMALEIERTNKFSEVCHNLIKLHVDYRENKYFIFFFFTYFSSSELFQIKPTGLREQKFIII